MLLPDFAIGVGVKVVEVPDDLVPQMELVAVGVETPTFQVFDPDPPTGTKDGEFKKVVVVGVRLALNKGDPVPAPLLEVDKNKFGGDDELFLLEFGGNKTGELFAELPGWLSNNLVVKVAVVVVADEDWDEVEFCLLLPNWLLVGDEIEVELPLYNIKFVFKSYGALLTDWLDELIVAELVFSIGTSAKTCGGGCVCA